MNRTLPPLHIDGIAFWASRPARLGDRARRDPRRAGGAGDIGASRPAPALLAPTERRRAPDTVALALEVASRACEAAGRSPQELPAVFASTHGDLAISDYMCATLVETPTLISPIKFHNSVHNAAAGYWSIGTGARAPYTALTAFHYTFATGLLEAATQAVCDARPVLYVAFDVEAKGALATMAPSRGLFATGLVIAPASAAQGRALSVSVRSGNDSETTRARSAAAPLIADNAMAPALPLFEALARDESASVVAALSASVVLAIDLS